MLLKNTKLRVIVAASAVSAITLGAFGFANSNTVPGTKVGLGEGAISGYVVSDIEYVFNATNPADINGVEFDLDTSANLVQVSLDGGTTWEDCSEDALHVTCTFDTPYSSETVTALQVFATDSAPPTP